MFALVVVVAVDVFKQLKSGIGGVFKATPLQHFAFECAHKRLAPSVVIGVGAGGHALAHACVGKHGTKGSAAILTAAITVEQSVLEAALLRP